VGTTSEGSPRTRLARAVSLAVVTAAIAAATVAPATAGRRARVVAAAGDIACPGRPCDSQEATARLVARMNPDAVLALGDTQYERGQYREYLRSYDPTWGRFKSRTYPVPGNHEYHTPRARGYFRYFGRRAHGPRGFYSFDLGKWHLVALNSREGDVPGSRQVRWLRRDLRRDRHRCELAYWHHARWSSGDHHGSNDHMAPFWKIAFDQGVDVALMGHEHNYERFAKLASSGRVTRRGVRGFVVGTGGIDYLDGFRSSPMRSSRARISQYGVLRLALSGRGYRWAFHTIDGSTPDVGSSRCHT
jgi:hypothetical protein